MENAANKSLARGRFPNARDATERNSVDSAVTAPIEVIRPDSPGEDRILVVDPDATFAHEIALALRQAGYSVFEATSFMDAKRLWRNESPHVLISDVRLGEFNGLQLLMRAKEERPETMAIITCAFSDVVLEMETRRLGGMFLVKPLEPGQVVAAVEAQANDLDRRGGDRRTRIIADAEPERRTTDRRAPLPVERRMGDRRQVVTPDFSPDRRFWQRRTPG
jgi:ActR/RegA family two-component response regulator